MCYAVQPWDLFQSCHTSAALGDFPEDSGPIGATKTSQMLQSSKSRLKDGKDMNQNNSKDVYGLDTETTSSAEEKIKIEGLVKEELEIDIGGIFFCDLCKYKSKWKAALIQCDYKTTSKGYPKQHKVSEHDTARYPCTHCDYKTKRKGDLKKHIDSVHRDVRYPCNQCDYKATRKESLKRHKDSVHGDVRYSCNQCDYKATRKDSLKTHKDSVHGEVCYTCDLCDYKSTSKNNVIRHIDSVHDYPCNQCGYKAAQKGNLIKNRL